MGALAIIQFKTYGACYHALHLAGTEADLEVLEMIPAGHQSGLLIRGTELKLKEFLQKISFTDLESAQLLSKLSDRIEKAFYGLEHAQLKSKMLVIEGESLGQLFKAAELGAERDYQVVDFKSPRGSVRWGVLILTAEDISDEYLCLVQGLGLSISLIASPSNLLKSFFDVEVK